MTALHMSPIHSDVKKNKVEWSFKKKRKEKKNNDKKKKKLRQCSLIKKKKEKKKEIKQTILDGDLPSPPIITKGAIITNLFLTIMLTHTLIIMYKPMFKFYTTSVWFDL